MSRHAVVLVGSVELGDLAATWAREGLLGLVLWLNSEAVPDVDQAHAWAPVTVRVLSSSAQPEVRFQHHLATGEPVSALTIGWIRAADEDFAARMSTLRTFGQRVIHLETAVRFLDIVRPVDESGPPTVAPVVGWEQLIVAPEDRPEVNGLDAGWGDRRDEVTLHVAAAVTGRLGGTALPIPHTADARIVTAWSRHITHADRLRGEVSRFFDAILPTLSAAEIEPHEFASFRDEREHGDEVLAWMRTLGDGSLRYVRAPSDVVESADSVASRDARVARADIRTGGPEKEAESAASPRSVEERAVMGIDADLRAEARSDGALIPAGVWRDVVMSLAATIDGGPLAKGAPQAFSQTHRLVVHPQIMWPDDELPAHRYSAEATRILPELDHHPPERIAASAVRVARAELRDEERTVPGVPFPALATSRNRANRRLVSKSIAADLKSQMSQRDELDGLGLDALGEPSSVMDRLMRDVLADAIRARFDAQRWHRAAVAPWPAQAPFRLLELLLWVLAAVLGTVGVLWLIDPAFMNSLVSVLGVGPWPPAPAAAVTLTGAAAAGLGAVWRRRRLGDGVDWRFRRMLRQHLASRARGAYADARRLDNALNLLSLWRRILLGVLPRSDSEADPQPPMDVSVPEALQRGALDMYQPFQQLQLGRNAAPPGWRGQALTDLAEISLAKYDDVPRQADSALQHLWSDPGFVEGPLHRVARDLPWQELRSRWIDVASSAAREDLVKRLPTMVGGQEGQGPRAFLSELAVPQVPLIWTALAGREVGQQTYRYGSLQPDDQHIIPSPSLFATAVLVVTRPLPPPVVRAERARSAVSPSDVL